MVSSKSWPLLERLGGGGSSSAPIAVAGLLQSLCQMISRVWPHFSLIFIDLFFCDFYPFHFFEDNPDEP
jgi:hypothetical protein